MKNNCRKDIPRLSFCITCKNRFHQIRHTLKKNLDDNRLFQDLIEFVLVDFGSSDGLYQWIVDNHTNDIQTGYLKYYYTDELTYWHASIAKNTAHILASNEILVNLDGDNFTGPYGCRPVIRNFLKQGPRTIVHQLSEKPYSGAFGRISVSRKSFWEAGGYDESFEPMGYQDVDLISRLQLNGHTYITQMQSKYNQAIPNTKEEGLRFSNTTAKWCDMVVRNQQISFRNIIKGKWIVNEGNFGIRKNIYDIQQRPVTFLL